MTSTDLSSSTSVEAEAETTRAGLVGTLNQLKENLKPSNMVEEVMGNAKVSAAAISDQVWETARKNPLPALMIGAGLAMIFGLGQRARAPVSDQRPSRGTPRSASIPAAGGPEFAAHIAKPASQTLGPEPSALGTAYDSVKMQAGDLLASANDRLAAGASAVGQQLRSSMKAGDAMSYTRSRDQMMGTLSRVLEEQPLVLAAIGIAVGAAIGAAIPQTETENSLMGEHSGSIKQAAQGMAQEQLAQLKSAASHAVEDIKQTAVDHGISADNLSGLVHDVADKAKSATYEAGKTLDPTAS